MLNRAFIFIAFFCLFTATGFYGYYLYKYPGPQNIDHLLKYYPEDIILQTGAALDTPDKRIQHFLNFPISKKKGAVRIGTFGDSFTYGYEVEKQETYPYQLQQLLNRHLNNEMYRCDMKIHNSDGSDSRAPRNDGLCGNDGVCGASRREQANSNEINTLSGGRFPDSEADGCRLRPRRGNTDRMSRKFPIHIEVLNFGKSGAGFQEQYFLWKKYGKKTGLDYFLLGPRLYSNRDITFRRNLWIGGYPKNRFILTNDTQQQFCGKFQDSPRPDSRGSGRFGLPGQCQNKTGRRKTHPIRPVYTQPCVNFPALFVPILSYRSGNQNPRPSGNPVDRNPEVSCQTGIKQVAVKGRTWKERYRNYYKLIPGLTVLRYDKQPFKMLEKLLPFLKDPSADPFLKGKINNPFYYLKRTTEEEVSRINTLLLKQIQKSHKGKILFFTDTDALFEPYQSLQEEYNLNRIDIPNGRLYTVFDHGSALFNEYLAKIYFHALLGVRSFSLRKISCRFTKNSGPAAKAEKPLFPLPSAKTIKLTDGQTPLASLRHNSADSAQGDYENHKISDTQSFMSFFSRSDFLESPFFPLSYSLKRNMKLRLYLPTGEKILLGTVENLDSHNKFFAFHQNYIRYAADYSAQSHRSYSYVVYFIRERMPPLLKKKISPGTKGAGLFIESLKVGALQPKNHPKHGEIYVFLPAAQNKKSFLMMGAFSGNVREADFAEEFPLYIHYTGNNGETFKSSIPDWTCKKEKQKIRLSLSRFQPLIYKSEETAQK